DSRIQGVRAAESTHLDRSRADVWSPSSGLPLVASVWTLLYAHAVPPRKSHQNSSYRRLREEIQVAVRQRYQEDIPHGKSRNNKSQKGEEESDDNLISTSQIISLMVEEGIQIVETSPRDDIESDAAKLTFSVEENVVMNGIANKDEADVDIVF
ncbi:hypothetical protein GE061_017161, partial [Apolygus lucorum]